jgi:hypothetical protein
MARRETRTTTKTERRSDPTRSWRRLAVPSDPGLPTQAKRLRQRSLGMCQATETVWLKRSH